MFKYWILGTLTFSKNILLKNGYFLLVKVVSIAVLPQETRYKKYEKLKI